MKQVSEFMSLYKEYESLLRDRGIDPKEYEEHADGSTAGRLRICRQFRNYISHNNDPGFLDISKLQLSFLVSQVEKISSSGDTVKKHMRTIKGGTCMMSDRCVDVIPRFEKCDTTVLAVVSSGSLCGFVSIFDVAGMALSGDGSSCTVESVKLLSRTKMPAVRYACPSDRFADMPANMVIVCTDDGTHAGKVAGIIYPDSVNV